MFLVLNGSCSDVQLVVSFFISVSFSLPQMSFLWRCHGVWSEPLSRFLLMVLYVALETQSPTKRSASDPSQYRKTHPNHSVASGEKVDCDRSQRVDARHRERPSAVSVVTSTKEQCSVHFDSHHIFCCGRSREVTLVWCSGVLFCVEKFHMFPVAGTVTSTNQEADCRCALAASHGAACVVDQVVDVPGPLVKLKLCSCPPQ